MLDNFFLCCNNFMIDKSTLLISMMKHEKQLCCRKSQFDYLRLILHKCNANYLFDWHFETNICNYWHSISLLIFLNNRKTVRPRINTTPHNSTIAHPMNIFSEPPNPCCDPLSPRYNPGPHKRIQLASTAKR